ncbi:type 3 dihydrofolate reductase [Buchnera aphidicola (Formosaphis micheliae)]|uniref:type 3 dihydrofolate reductase n=1 Tax=Buchnera aphidicola TaxID=9 RepID=UPI0031B89661
MNISIIAAISKNKIIGNNNNLPWNLPPDLIWFKKHTLHKSIIMGRLTWESIGKPLPMRENIIISKKKIYHSGIIWAKSIKDGIKLAKYNKEIMIIGGSSIYEQTLHMTNTLYLTKLHKNIPGDKYFPNYKKIKWNRIYYKYVYANHIINFDYQFEILKKIVSQ